MLFLAIEPSPTVQRTQNEIDVGDSRLSRLYIDRFGRCPPGDDALRMTAVDSCKLSSVVVGVYCWHLPNVTTGIFPISLHVLAFS